VLNAPQHPYTQSLIEAVPSLTPRPPREQSTQPVLKVDGLSKVFRSGGSLLGLSGSERTVKAAQDVSLELRRGETLGIVGESGSGKSTLARCIVRLIEADTGSILLKDVDLQPLSRSEMRSHRSSIQMMFQDPFASLNPRTKVGKIVTQGPILQGVRRATAANRYRKGTCT